MTCECKTGVEAKLLERFKEQSPEATGHAVELNGYALLFTPDHNIVQKGCMTMTTRASFPLKKGGVKEKKETGNMVFTYCPFCGVAYTPANENLRT